MRGYWPRQRSIFHCLYLLGRSSPCSNSSKVRSLGSSQRLPFRLIEKI